MRACPAGLPVKAHAPVRNRFPTSGFGPSLREDIGATNEVIGNDVARKRKTSMTSLHYLQTAPIRASAQIQALTHASSMREKVFEHLLLADLGMELMARGIEFEVLHGETDRDGHDLIIEAGGILRHIQLKVTILGGARSEITVNTRLAGKPAGCVVWLSFDPASRSFESIRWFGSAPGAPLPDPGDKVARHSRANAQGVKNHREGHRILPASRFIRLDDIAHLADRLFGRQPSDPLAFLYSRLQPQVATATIWPSQVANGDFTAIPRDLGWGDEAIQLADLLDGYRLLELAGGEDPDAFLEHQRDAQRATGQWPGDPALLWTTLFLEARADRFGANDHRGTLPHLDLLCRQLRDALVELETNHA
jgi:hypothetical protein